MNMEKEIIELATDLDYATLTDFQILSISMQIITLLLVTLLTIVRR